MKIIKVVDLEKIKELEKLEDVYKKIISVLLAAINDWPKPIDKLEDYESEVYNFVGDDVTENELKLCLSRIDYSNSSWEAESLSQLVEVFRNSSNGKTLKEIIEDLKVKLKNENW